MKKILVVDDDALFREIMKRHLTRMGFVVLENDSGRGVVNQILNESPEACIIDIIMDKKEGLETIKEIKLLSNRPKIIAVSSNATYLEWAEALGADDIICKPVAPQTLQDTLNQLGVAAK